MCVKGLRLLFGVQQTRQICEMFSLERLCGGGSRGPELEGTNMCRCAHVHVCRCDVLHIEIKTLDFGDGFRIMEGRKKKKGWKREIHLPLLPTLSGLSYMWKTRGFFII